MLVLRQKRLELSHQIARHCQEIDLTRQRTWDRQARIASRLEPGQLREALDRTGLLVEPVVTPEAERPHAPIALSRVSP